MSRKTAAIWAILVLIALGLAACSAITVEPPRQSRPRTSRCNPLREPPVAPGATPTPSRTVRRKEPAAVVTFEDRGRRNVQLQFFFGSYTLDGDSFPSAIGSTLMACPTPSYGRSRTSGCARRRRLCDRRRNAALLDAAGGAVATFTLQAEAAASAPSASPGRRRLSARAGRFVAHRRHTDPALLPSRASSPATPAATTTTACTVDGNTLR